MDKQKIIEHCDSSNPYINKDNCFEKSVYRRGFAAAVELLWPVVEACEEACIIENFRKVQPWDAIADLKTKLNKPNQPEQGSEE